MSPSASRQSPIRWTSFLAATLAVALLGAGCAGDGDEADTTTATRGAAATDERPAGEGDASAAPLTLANLHDHEQDWPNVVKLVRAWTPPGESEPVPANARGVLVRVDREGNPRVDFGRHGKYDVPADATDLLERANRVRDGGEFKNRPNFLRQVGNRMVHPTADPMRALKSPEFAGKDAYLCVFADPTDAAFPGIARRLAEATADRNVMVVLFPEALGRDDVIVVRKRLAELDWPVPYMYPHLVEDYRQALLGYEVELPTLVVVTAHGRLLFRGPLDERLDEIALEAALAADRTTS